MMAFMSFNALSATPDGAVLKPGLALLTKAAAGNPPPAEEVVACIAALQA